MYNYPILFKSMASANGGTNSTWEINSGHHKTLCAIPPEFMGPGGGFSPEDLFLQALTNCFIATFKVYAEHSKLFFEQITINSELSVDKVDTNKVTMKKCHFMIKINNPSNKDKAELLVKKTFDSGFILNSVKTDLSYTLELSPTT